MFMYRGILDLFPFKFRLSHDYYTGRLLCQTGSQRNIIVRKLAHTCTENGISPRHSKVFSPSFQCISWIQVLNLLSMELKLCVPMHLLRYNLDQLTQHCQYKLSVCLTAVREVDDVFQIKAPPSSSSLKVVCLLVDGTVRRFFPSLDDVSSSSLNVVSRLLRWTCRRDLISRKSSDFPERLN